MIAWCGLELPEEKVDENKLVLSTVEDTGPGEWTDVVGPVIVRRIEDFDAKQRLDMLCAMMYGISPDAKEFPEALPWWARTSRRAAG